MTSGGQHFEPKITEVWLVQMIFLFNFRWIFSFQKVNFPQCALEIIGYPSVLETRQKKNALSKSGHCDVFNWDFVPQGISLFLFRDNFGRVFGILFEETYSLSDLYLCLSLDLHQTMVSFVSLLLLISLIGHWSLFFHALRNATHPGYPKILKIYPPTGVHLEKLKTASIPGVPPGDRTSSGTRGMAWTRHSFTTLVGGWINHPFEKYDCRQIGSIFPKFSGMNMFKNIWVETTNLVYCCFFWEEAKNPKVTPNQCVQLSYEKNPPTFHYTGWFIGILILAYENPHLIG